MKVERTTRLRETAGAFAVIALTFLPLALLVRAYELLAVSRAHVLPPGVGALAARGAADDLLVVLWASAALLPLLLLAQVAPRAAAWLQRGALALLAMAGVALAQYFAVTYVPLGADLFGYDWEAVKQTASASGALTLAGLLPVLAAGALTWALTGLAMRLPAPRPLVAGFFALVVASVPLAGALAAKPGDFASDAAYFLAANKTAYFSGRAAGYLAQGWGGEAEAPEGELTGYPLMHPADYGDVLGPFLELGDRPPNLVIVIVEGLGSDFVGSGHLGGFTPFIDSLAARSLDWENFLSTSGRTFGILPALLGSLPYGESGFVELRERMPAHQSLAGLLKERGYTIDYFTGSDGHFDYVDLFMERQGVDGFLDQGGFGEGFEKAPSDAGGFSWGYADHDLFQRAFEVLGPTGPEPRLDVYHTGTTHEPFIPPHAEQYGAEFERRLAAMPLSPARREEYRRYAGVFASLLYADDAVEYLVREYEKRPEFDNTILIITGDHRLIPVPPRTRIDRYRVPLIVHSKMVKAPQRFASVSSHLDLTPTLLAMLQRRYDLALPEQAHWLGGAIDTVRAFRSVHSLPLMRTKNALDEYLDGDVFVSQGEVFRLEAGMGLRPLPAGAGAEASAKLARFRRVNRYVTTQDRVYPGAAGATVAKAAATRDDSLYAALGVDSLDSDQLFALAREKALAKEYEAARLICRQMLGRAPNLHDVRTLLGRTYAWERRFDEARPIFRDVMRRAPGYLDARVALIDLELWDGRADVALALADSGLAAFPRDAELLARRERAAAR